MPTLAKTTLAMSIKLLTSYILGYLQSVLTGGYAVKNISIVNQLVTSFVGNLTEVNAYAKSTVMISIL